MEIMNLHINDPDIFMKLCDILCITTVNNGK